MFATFVKMFIKSKLFLFFILSYLISWIIWLPLYGPLLGITGLHILPYHHAVGAIGPIASAFIVCAVCDRKYLKELAGSMLRWRVPVWCYMAAVVAPLVILIIAVAIESYLTGIGFHWRLLIQSREFPAFSTLRVFAYNLFTFGYGEETGWRGYALPLLQRKYNRLSSNLLLTLGWAAWHIPLFLYRPGYTGMGPAEIIGWLFSLFAGTILLTWLYNGSRGSILIAALFHAMIDVAFTSAAAGALAVNIMGGMVSCWAILVLILLRKQRLVTSFIQEKGLSN
jgi:membrane protease YdiL (CAAX protease family)